MDKKEAENKAKLEKEIKAKEGTEQIATLEDENKAKKIAEIKKNEEEELITKRKAKEDTKGQVRQEVDKEISDTKLNEGLENNIELEAKISSKEQIVFKEKPTSESEDRSTKKETELKVTHEDKIKTEIGADIEHKEEEKVSVEGEYANEQINVNAERKVKLDAENKRKDKDTNAELKYTGENEMERKIQQKYEDKETKEFRENEHLTNTEEVKERSGDYKKNRKVKDKEYSEKNTTSKAIDINLMNGNLMDKQVLTYETDNIENKNLKEHRKFELTKGVSDLGLDMYKPTSYHGPRFSERKPTFTSNLTNRTATADCRVKMTCSVIGEEVEINWLKNGEPISSEHNNYYMQFSNNVATLEVLNTTVNDTAEYACIAKNENGVSTTSACLKVIQSFDSSPLPPVFTRPIRDQYRITNEELILECRIRCQPPPIIKWYKNGEELGTSVRYAQSYLADGICRLSVSNPDKNDSGKYTCRAENKSGTEQISHDVKFTTKEDYIKEKSEQRTIYKPARESRRSYFSGVLTDNFVPLGGVMALQVQIKGSPADITWFKESQKLPKASSRHRTFEERGVHTLVVPNINEYEAGKYTCRASNSYGRIESSAYVQVIHPSLIREGKPAMFLSRPEKTLNIATGEDIVVSFRVSGDPKPRVTWMKGLTDITDSMRSLKETSDDYVRFTLKRATGDDVGTYCILAKNRYGCDRAFFTVRLRYRARSVTPSRDETWRILTEIPTYRERRYLT
ncbi:hypothetical protein NQ314_005688, partial [Rhamnusium bicolor]